MLRLYIMRHAKSSWASPGARDFDRELNDRGLLDLVKLSKVIKSEKIFPEKILCSSAIRTRQTLEAIETAFGNEPEVLFTERLYSSGMNEYIEIINAVQNVQSLMIIGHNPMCGNLASNLPKAGDKEELEKIAYKYPTGTISIIEFDFDHWQQVAVSTGNLKKSIFLSQI